MTDLETLNREAELWMQNISDERRFHEDPKLLVRDAFQDERPKLLPSPSEPFPCADRIAVRIGRRHMHALMGMTIQSLIRRSDGR